MPKETFSSGNQPRYPLVNDLLEICFEIDTLPKGKSIENLFQDSINNRNQKTLEKLYDLIEDGVNFINTMIIGVFCVMISLSFADASFKIPFLIASLLVAIIGFFNFKFFQFKDLSYLELARFAKRIVSNYPESKIKKIMLHDHIDELSQYINGARTSTYLISIWVKPNGSTERLKIAVANIHKTLNEHYSIEFGIDERFPRVYKASVPENFLNEWSFLVFPMEDGSIPKGLSKHSWCLYYKFFT